MTLRNPTLCLLPLVSILTFGCAELDCDGPADDSEQLDDSELGTVSSELTSVLGGVDMNAGCKIAHGPWASAVLLGSPYSTWAITNWRCQSLGTQYSINVTQFCRWQYLLPTASATWTDPNNAYSWQCVISI